MKLKTIFPVLLLSCALVWPAALHAAPRGLLISVDQLSPSHRTQLRREVASARRQHPATFRTLAQLQARLPQIAARQRGRLVTVVMPLRALGREGLMPMLAAITGGDDASLGPRARLGYQVSLLEAVGSLRDGRSRPVLEAILDGQHPEVVQRVAARALARLGNAAAVASLLKRVAAPGARWQVLLPALGECRRARVAGALAQILKQGKQGNQGNQGGDDALALAALGQVGNAWAWQTPAVASSGEGDETRRIAMQAVVASRNPAHAEAIKALRLIAHPSTMSAIATERRTADPGRRQALDRLARALQAGGMVP